MKATKAEKKVLKESKNFAVRYGIPFDKRTETIVLNAMRQAVLDASAAISRVEIIDQNGRDYVRYAHNETFRLEWQDQGQTVKLFVQPKSKTNQ